MAVGVLVVAVVVVRVEVVRVVRVDGDGFGVRVEEDNDDRVLIVLDAVVREDVVVERVEEDDDDGAVREVEALVDDAEETVVVLVRVDVEVLLVAPELDVSDARDEVAVLLLVVDVLEVV